MVAHCHRRPTGPIRPPGGVVPLAYCHRLPVASILSIHQSGPILVGPLLVGPLLVLCLQFKERLPTPHNTCHNLYGMGTHRGHMPVAAQTGVILQARDRVHGHSIAAVEYTSEIKTRVIL
ncbi:hypothetical protein ACLKA6_001194 [Drosophila palustris]